MRGSLCAGGRPGLLFSFPPNLTCCCCKDHSFKDEQLFYRFTVDDARASTEHRRWSELIAPVFGDGDTDAAGFNPGPARLQRGNPLSDSVLNVIQSLHVTPLDAHNLKLLSNVHPPAWTSATPAPRCTYIAKGAPPFMRIHSLLLTLQTTWS